MPKHYEVEVDEIINNKNGYFVFKTKRGNRIKIKLNPSNKKRKIINRPSIESPDKFIDHFLQNRQPRSQQMTIFDKLANFLNLHGKAGSGKTTFVMNLLEQPQIQSVYGDRIYVISMSRATLKNYYNF